jgi:hypothetical protein
MVSRSSTILPCSFKTVHTTGRTAQKNPFFKAKNALSCTDSAGNLFTGGHKSLHIPLSNKVVSAHKTTEKGTGTAPGLDLCIQVCFTIPISFHRPDLKRT